MNKQQRDYAIKRAKNIINSSNPTQAIPKIKNLDVLISLGLTKAQATEANLKYGAASFCDKLTAYLPAYSDNLIKCERIRKENEQVDITKCSLIREAEDFIMLGTDSQVLEYLHDLEK